MTRSTSALALLVFPGTARAEPDYDQSILTSVFPAGGQQGTSVTVRFTGTNNGLAGADSVLIDGAPGVTVSDIKPAGKNQLEATLTISAEAAPGRRMVRVRGGVNGITNFRWFFVSPLREFVEKEKNNSPDTAEELTQPAIVNGRVSPVLDQDCFRFEAKEGQNLVLAVMSHWMDSVGYGRTNSGFSDTSLELLGADGRVLAESGDALGYDPLIEHRIPADGWYTARVSGMGFKGHPEMIYRLTIGEMPYPTAIFPAGGRRGETVDVELSGPNIPSGFRQKITVEDDPFPVQYVSVEGDFSGVAQVPFIRDDLPGQAIQTPPAQAEGEPGSEAQPLTLPSSITGRFDEIGDADLFEIELEKGESITLDVMAQRHLRSPVDTLVEVFDKKRERVALNDDGVIYQGECTHDFVPFDSFLVYRAKKPGKHFIRVSEQSGTAGPRCVYRLTATRTAPDFRLFQWPDAVPVFGPGSTAAFVVETHRLGGLNSDIEIFVEGLPEGWRSSTSTSFFRDYRDPRGATGHKTFVSLTAPDDAKPGDTASFRVVGRATSGETQLERTAQPLTLYMWQEPNHFRYSTTSRVVVARPKEVSLTSLVESVTAKAGETASVPIRVVQTGEKPATSMSFSINRAITHFKCSIGAPVTVHVNGEEATVPFKVPATWKPGVYEFLIADSWNSETRKGLPGPCTQVVRLVVE